MFKKIKGIINSIRNTKTDINIHTARDKDSKNI